MYTISEVSRMSGLSARSIRYYEEQQMFLPSARAENNYRTFSEEDVRQLMLIHELRSVGFNVKEIRQILRGNQSEIYRVFSHHKRELIREAGEIARSIEKNDLLLEHILEGRDEDAASEEGAERTFAVLFINFQNSYFSGKYGKPENESMLTAVNRLGEWSFLRGMPHIFCMDAPGEKALDYDVQPPAKLQVHDTDIRIEKYYYDAFKGSNLDYVLQKKHVTDIIITGLYTDLAVYTTALTAWDRNLRVWLVKECLRSHEESSEKFALESLAANCDAHIFETVKELFAAMRS